MHRWAAHGMVITVFLHMVRVFYTGSYKPPREFNWVVGTLLFVLTILLSYTGYLLPWDQLAFWAVTVGYNIAQATPFVGDEVSFVLFGGYQLGANALLRFYVLHVVALPLTAGFLIAIHFWRIRKDGGISGPL
jgi:quinol-cytochrome oxidoreductase complex cytochrome b subunit